MRRASIGLRARTAVAHSVAALADALKRHEVRLGAALGAGTLAAALVVGLQLLLDRLREPSGQKGPK